MSYFKSLVKETAAPLAESEYNWYKYNGMRATNITNTSGNRTLRLENGVLFGLRKSSDGKSYRLISKELGKNIVFTLQNKFAESITTRAAPLRSGKGKSSPEKIKQSKLNLHVSDDNAAKLLVIGKKVFSDLVANTECLEALRKFNGWVDTNKPVSEKTLANLAAIKYGKREIPKQTKDEKLQRAADQAMKLAKRYVKINFFDAADMVNLAIKLKTNNAAAIKKMSFDTNIREDMPKHLYDTYSALHY